MNSKELEAELHSILDYWATEVYDEEMQLFIGRTDNKGRQIKQSPLGLVLYSRILWAFSAGFAATGQAVYKERAKRCYLLLKDYFYDREYGGFYWSVQVDGEPLSQRKQIYGQAFVLYGLIEYYRISGHQQVLQEAWQQFDLIEKYSFDPASGGYLDAFERDWSPIQDMRLSLKDMNAAKTMNTHLHILEAYTSLFSVSGDSRAGSGVKALLNIFNERILDPQKGYLNLYFSREWESMAGIQSYGHDMEASWLLLEAIDTVYRDGEAPAGLVNMCYQLADAARGGLLSDGSMACESVWGQIDRERHWWIQAEAAVGFRRLAVGAQRADYRALSDRIWNYIVQEIKDPVHGEWFWGRDEQGEVLWLEDKTGLWKGPYHTTRACLELLKLMKMEENAAEDGRK